MKEFQNFNAAARWVKRHLAVEAWGVTVIARYKAAAYDRRLSGHHPAVDSWHAVLFSRDPSGNQPADRLMQSVTGTFVSK